MKLFGNCINSVADSKAPRTWICTVSRALIRPDPAKSASLRIRMLPLLKTTLASAVLIEDGISFDRPPRKIPAVAALRTDNPYFAFARAIELFYKPPTYAPGIHPSAIIAPGAKLGPSAHVGPYCFIDEDVEIGSAQAVPVL